MFCPLMLLTTIEQVAATYTLMTDFILDQFKGWDIQTPYRNPVGYTAPFSCVGHSDAGTGTDAGSDSNAMVLGANPTLSGQGCLDGQDTSDSYQFPWDYNNVHVMSLPIWVCHSLQVCMTKIVTWYLDGMVQSGLQWTI